MKLVLYQLIYLGVVQPIACGILIEGSKCGTFIMDLPYNGVYRMIKLSKADLCLSFRQLPLFPYFFEDIMRLRALTLKVAQAAKGCHIYRHLGKETPDKTPLSWLRKSTTKVERISLACDISV
ncbi:MAG: hypothetical protein EXX96DRAFT_564878 [Benjaminiella poitrasii]|nr:MAG: hypothetical protein EXX96DRAFT_564878 [Benjaminiella poitrasii]